MSTATVNGVDLAYVEHGQGEPVVFVHGGSGVPRLGSAAERVRCGFRAIALSCRGYWPNPKLRPDESISLDSFVDDLAQFIRALDTGPVHLVGHSSPGGLGGPPRLTASGAAPQPGAGEPPAFPLLGVSLPPDPPR